MSATGGPPGDDSGDPGYTDYGIRYNVPPEEMYRPPLSNARSRDLYTGPIPAPGAPMPQYTRVVKQHPEGTTILVLGILSIVICPLIGPLAWSMGNKAMAQVRFSGYTYSNAGFIRAGRLLAVVATVLMAVYVVVVIALVANMPTTPTPSQP